jgi:hypothetical protein
MLLNDSDFAPSDDGKHLEKDGLVLSGIDKLRAEWMERSQDSPEAVFGQPFSAGAWNLVAADLRQQRMKCQTEGLKEPLDIALFTAANMPPGWTPWDALVHQAYSCEDAFGKSDPIAQRLLREACYLALNREFVGRQVG